MVPTVPTPFLKCGVFVLLALLAIPACTFLETLPGHVDGPSKGEVQQVMVIWADGVVVQPDAMNQGVPTPGLSGRVYLFGPELGTPLEAQGALVVHLYDDQPAVHSTPVPREIWTLDPDNLKRVLRKDVLGWGYNLWLPWSTYSPEIKKVSLVVQHKPAKGQEAWSGNMVLTVGGPGNAPKTPSRLETHGY